MRINERRLLPSSAEYKCSEPLTIEPVSFTIAWLMRIDDAHRLRQQRNMVAKFTSKDVARLAGVAQSTVSYVMSGNRPISDATRTRVLEAIEALTYQPNAGARALASQRTRVIGLMVVPVHGPGLDGVPDAGA